MNLLKSSLPRQNINTLSVICESQKNQTEGLPASTRERTTKKDSSWIDQSQNLINFVFIIEIRQQNQYNLGAGNW